MGKPETTDHTGDERVLEGARLIIETPIEQRPKATVPWLRDVLGLGPADAIQAIREAQLRRARSL